MTVILIAIVFVFVTLLMTIMGIRRAEWQYYIEVVSRHSTGETKGIR